MIKIFDILEFFEVDRLYESRNMLIGCCPIHDGDNQTAFNINVDFDNESHYGKWFCNTHHCDKIKSGNDIFTLVWLLLEKKNNKSYSFPGVVKFCEDFCEGVSVDESVSFVRKQAIDKLIKPKRNILDEKRITRDFVRKSLSFPAQFYIDRGFTKEALDFFDVGVCINPKRQMHNRIVFPVYDENDMYMVGCTGRTIVNDPRKWINQEGFSKSNFLYNYGKAIECIRKTSTIILTEGQGDVIRLWEAGIHNAVGLFGAKLSDAQEFLIQQTGASNVVLMPDNDDAGRLCVTDIKEKLQFLFNIYDVKYPTKDVGEMTVDQINSIVKPQIKGKF